MELSDYIPHVAGCADICLVRSMYTSMQSSPRAGSPDARIYSIWPPDRGGLGNVWIGQRVAGVPAFVVLSSGRGTSAGSNNWTSGFLPSSYQGVVFRSSGDPILYLANPKGINQESQSARLEAIQKLNAERERDTGDASIASRIHSYELAFRMQMAAPKLLDFSDETPKTLEMYGVNKEDTRPYATN